MKKKRSGLFRFILSFLPGAGEMYMGFMKMGVSLMAAFFGIFAVSTFLNFGPLLFVNIIVWFYSFFHVHNLAGMPDGEFEALEDDYLIHPDRILEKAKTSPEKTKKLISAGLIILGIVLIYQGLCSIFYTYLPDWIYRIFNQLTYHVPKVLIGAAIIYLGVKMIMGKKEEMEALESEEDRNEGA